MVTETGTKQGSAGLSGSYLLIILGQPIQPEHTKHILSRISKGLLSWRELEAGCEINTELELITKQILECASTGISDELLIQQATDSLAVEVLLNPQVSTLIQCMKNLLISTTKHKHLIHAGYAYTGSGSWILQDGTYSLFDFIDSFEDEEVQTVIKSFQQYSPSIHIHCASEGDWNEASESYFPKQIQIRLNPHDNILETYGINKFTDCIESFLDIKPLEKLLPSSEIVGNIRFNRPTLYVFPGGQGDSSIFGVSGFNMLVDGGFQHRSCFWDFVRHLDRVDAILMTAVNENNINGMATLIRRKISSETYPQIGHVFCNVVEGKESPGEEMKKEKDQLLVDIIEEAQFIVERLKGINLRSQLCLREDIATPKTLYHKVGHGSLYMYTLNPISSSKELNEFFDQWKNQVRKFSSVESNLKESGCMFNVPLPDATSICALLVWKPADPNDTITRVLLPGSTPQDRILEAFRQLNELEELHHPLCNQHMLGMTNVSKKKIQKIDSKKSAKKTKVVKKSVSKSENILKSDQKPSPKQDSNILAERITKNNVESNKMKSLIEVRRITTKTVTASNSSPLIKKTVKETVKPLSVVSSTSSPVKLKRKIKVIKKKKKVASSSTEKATVDTNEESNKLETAHVDVNAERKNVELGDTKEIAPEETTEVDKKEEVTTKKITKSPKKKTIVKKITKVSPSSKEVKPSPTKVDKTGSLRVSAPASKSPVKKIKKITKIRKVSSDKVKVEKPDEVKEVKVTEKVIKMTKESPVIGAPKKKSPQKEDKKNSTTPQKPKVLKKKASPKPELAKKETKPDAKTPSSDVKSKKIIKRTIKKTSPEEATKSTTLMQTQTKTKSKVDSKEKKAIIKSTVVKVGRAKGEAVTMKPTEVTQQEPKAVEVPEVELPKVDAVKSPEMSQEKFVLDESEQETPVKEGDVDAKLSKDVIVEDKVPSETNKVPIPKLETEQMTVQREVVVVTKDVESRPLNAPLEEAKISDKTMSESLENVEDLPYDRTEDASEQDALSITSIPQDEQKSSKDDKDHKLRYDETVPSSKDQKNTQEEEELVANEFVNPIFCEEDEDKMGDKDSVSDLEDKDSDIQYYEEETSPEEIHSGKETLNEFDEVELTFSSGTVENPEYDTVAANYPEHVQLPAEISTSGSISPKIESEVDKYQLNELKKSMVSSSSKDGSSKEEIVVSTDGDILMVSTTATTVVSETKTQSLPLLDDQRPTLDETQKSLPELGDLETTDDQVIIFEPEGIDKMQVPLGSTSYVNTITSKTTTVVTKQTVREDVHPIEKFESKTSDYGKEIFEDIMSEVSKKEVPTDKGFKEMKGAPQYNVTDTYETDVRGTKSLVVEARKEIIEKHEIEHEECEKKIKGLPEPSIDFQEPVAVSSEVSFTEVSNSATENPKEKIPNISEESSEKISLGEVPELEFKELITVSKVTRGVVESVSKPKDDLSGAKNNATKEITDDLELIKLTDTKIDTVSKDTKEDTILTISKETTEEFKPESKPQGKVPDIKTDSPKDFTKNVISNEPKEVFESVPRPTDSTEPKDTVPGSDLKSIDATTEFKETKEVLQAAPEPQMTTSKKPELKSKDVESDILNDAPKPVAEETTTTISQETKEVLEMVPKPQSSKDISETTSTESALKPGNKIPKDIDEPESKVTTVTTNSKETTDIFEPTYKMEDFPKDVAKPVSKESAPKPEDSFQKDASEPKSKVTTVTNISEETKDVLEEAPKLHDSPKQAPETTSKESAPKPEDTIQNNTPESRSETTDIATISKQTNKEVEETPKLKDSPKEISEPTSKESVPMPKDTVQKDVSESTSKESAPILKDTGHADTVEPESTVTTITTICKETKEVLEAKVKFQDSPKDVPELASKESAPKPEDTVLNNSAEPTSKESVPISKEKVLKDGVVHESTGTTSTTICKETTEVLEATLKSQDSPTNVPEPTSKESVPISEVKAERDVVEHESKVTMITTIKKDAKEVSEAAPKPQGSPKDILKPVLKESAIVPKDTVQNDVTEFKSNVTSITTICTETKEVLEEVPKSKDSFENVPDPTSKDVSPKDKIPELLKKDSPKEEHLPKTEITTVRTIYKEAKHALEEIPKSQDCLKDISEPTLKNAAPVPKDTAPESLKKDSPKDTSEPGLKATTVTSITKETKEVLEATPKPQEIQKDDSELTLKESTPVSEETFPEEPESKLTTIATICKETKEVLEMTSKLQDSPKDISEPISKDTASVPEKVVSELSKNDSPRDTPVPGSETIITITREEKEVLEVEPKPQDIPKDVSEPKLMESEPIPEFLKKDSSKDTHGPGSEVTTIKTIIKEKKEVLDETPKLQDSSKDGSVPTSNNVAPTPKDTIPDTLKKDSPKDVPESGSETTKITTISKQTSKSQDSPKDIPEPIIKAAVPVLQDSVPESLMEVYPKDTPESGSETTSITTIIKETNKVIELAPKPQDLPRDCIESSSKELASVPKEVEELLKKDFPKDMSVSESTVTEITISKETKEVVLKEIPTQQDSSKVVPKPTSKESVPVHKDTVEELLKNDPPKDMLVSESTVTTITTISNEMKEVLKEAPIPQDSSKVVQEPTSKESVTVPKDIGEDVLKKDSPSTMQDSLKDVPDVLKKTEPVTEDNVSEPLKRDFTKDTSETGLKTTTITIISKETTKPQDSQDKKSEPMSIDSSLKNVPESGSKVASVVVEPKSKPQDEEFSSKEPSTKPHDTMPDLLEKDCPKDASQPEEIVTVTTTVSEEIQEVLESTIKTHESPKNTSEPKLTEPVPRAQDEVPETLKKDSPEDAPNDSVSKETKEVLKPEVKPKDAPEPESLKKYSPKDGIENTSKELPIRPQDSVPDLIKKDTSELESKKNAKEVLNATPRPQDSLESTSNEPTPRTQDVVSKVIETTTIYEDQKEVLKSQDSTKNILEPESKIISTTTITKETKEVLESVSKSKDSSKDLPEPKLKESKSKDALPDLLKKDYPESETKVIKTTTVCEEVKKILDPTHKQQDSPKDNLEPKPESKISRKKTEEVLEQSPKPQDILKKDLMEDIPEPRSKDDHKISKDVKKDSPEFISKEQVPEAQDKVPEAPKKDSTQPESKVCQDTKEVLKQVPNTIVSPKDASKPTIDMKSQEKESKDVIEPESKVEDLEYLTKETKDVLKSNQEIKEVTSSVTITKAMTVQKQPEVDDAKTNRLKDDKPKHKTEENYGKDLLSEIIEAPDGYKSDSRTETTTTVTTTEAVTKETPKDKEEKSVKFETQLNKPSIDEPSVDKTLKESPKNGDEYLDNFWSDEVIKDKKIPEVKDVKPNLFDIPEKDLQEELPEPITEEIIPKETQDFVHAIPIVPDEDSEHTDLSSSEPTVIVKTVELPDDKSKSDEIVKRVNVPDDDYESVKLKEEPEAKNIIIKKRPNGSEETVEYVGDIPEEDLREIIELKCTTVTKDVLKEERERDSPESKFEVSPSTSGTKKPEVASSDSSRIQTVTITKYIVIRKLPDGTEQEIEYEGDIPEEVKKSDAKITIVNKNVTVKRLPDGSEEILEKEEEVPVKDSALAIAKNVTIKELPTEPSSITTTVTEHHVVEKSLPITNKEDSSVTPKDKVPNHEKGGTEASRILIESSKILPGDSEDFYHEPSTSSTTRTTIITRNVLIRKMPDGTEEVVEYEGEIPQEELEEVTERSTTTTVTKMLPVSSDGVVSKDKLPKEVDTESTVGDTQTESDKIRGTTNTIITKSIFIKKLADGTEEVVEYEGKIPENEIERLSKSSYGIGGQKPQGKLEELKGSTTPTIIRKNVLIKKLLDGSEEVIEYEGELDEAESDDITRSTTTTTITKNVVIKKLPDGSEEVVECEDEITEDELKKVRGTTTTTVIKNVLIKKLPDGTEEVVEYEDELPKDEVKKLDGITTTITKNILIKKLPDGTEKADKYEGEITEDEMKNLGETTTATTITKKIIIRKLPDGTEEVVEYEGETPEDEIKKLSGTTTTTTTTKNVFIKKLPDGTEEVIEYEGEIPEDDMEKLGGTTTTNTVTKNVLINKLPDGTEEIIEYEDESPEEVIKKLSGTTTTTTITKKVIIRKLPDGTEEIVEYEGETPEDEIEKLDGITTTTTIIKNVLIKKLPDGSEEIFEFEGEIPKDEIEKISGTTSTTTITKNVLIKKLPDGTEEVIEYEGEIPEDEFENLGGTTTTTTITNNVLIKKLPDETEEVIEYEGGLPKDDLEKLGGTTTTNTVTKKVLINKLPDGTEEIIEYEDESPEDVIKKLSGTTTSTAVTKKVLIKKLPDGSEEVVEYEGEIPEDDIEKLGETTTLTTISKSVMIKKLPDSTEEEVEYEDEIPKNDLEKLRGSTITTTVTKNILIKKLPDGSEEIVEYEGEIPEDEIEKLGGTTTTTTITKNVLIKKLPDGSEEIFEYEGEIPKDEIEKISGTTSTTTITRNVLIKKLPDGTEEVIEYDGEIPEDEIEKLGGTTATTTIARKVIIRKLPDGTEEVVEYEGEIPEDEIVKLSGTTTTTKNVFIKNLPDGTEEVIEYEGEIPEDELEKATGTTKTIITKSVLIKTLPDGSEEVIEYEGDVPEDELEKVCGSNTTTITKNVVVRKLPDGSEEIVDSESDLSKMYSTETITKNVIVRKLPDGNEEVIEVEGDITNEELEKLCRSNTTTTTVTKNVLIKKLPDGSEDVVEYEGEFTEDELTKMSGATTRTITKEVLIKKLPDGSEEVVKLEGEFPKDDFNTTSGSTTVTKNVVVRKLADGSEEVIEYEGDIPEGELEKLGATTTTTAVTKNVVVKKLADGSEEVIEYEGDLTEEELDKLMERGEITETEIRKAQGSIKSSSQSRVIESTKKNIIVRQLPDGSEETVEYEGQSQSYQSSSSGHSQDIVEEVSTSNLIIKKLPDGREEVIEYEGNLPEDVDFYFTTPNAQGGAHVGHKNTQSKSKSETMSQMEHKATTKNIIIKKLPDGTEKILEYQGDLPEEVIISDKNISGMSTRVSKSSTFEEVGSTESYSKTTTTTSSSVFQEETSTDCVDSSRLHRSSGPQCFGFDPLEEWGEPMGAPPPPPTQPSNGSPKKVIKNIVQDNRNGHNEDDPVYLDLAYVPNHGHPSYCDIEFFMKIRARYYVFSGINPNRSVFNALLEAKKSWGEKDKDLEVTIIPTYDTDTLGYWMALNQDALAEHKIELAPSASRCTINLQDHETSCAAYRLEF